MPSCTGPSAVAADGEAAPAPAADQHHDPTYGLYLYYLDSTHIGVARCQSGARSAASPCVPLPYEATLTSEFQGRPTGWPASLAELTATTSSPARPRGHSRSHSSQLASLAMTAVPGMLKMSAATLSQISRNLPLITTAIAALGGLVQVQIRRHNAMQPGELAAPQNTMPFVGRPAAPERQPATAYPPLLPPQVTELPRHRIVPFRQGREPQPGGSRPTLLAPDVTQEPARLISSPVPAPPAEVLECIQLIYPVDPGFLQHPRRSSPLRRFVPTLNPAHPDTIHDCLTTLNQADDPSLQLLIQERTYLTTAPNSPYQNWLRDDDTRTTAASGAASTSSGSAHHRPSQPSYLAMVKMFAALDYAHVDGSGLFEDEEEFTAMQRQARDFMAYLREVDEQISHTAVSMAGLDHYWYRVRLLDHLTTRARTGSTDATALQAMELIRALKALSMVSTKPLATILDEDVLTTERESQYAHPSHSHNPAIHRSQLEHIVSRMIQIIAHEAGAEPRPLRDGIRLLLQQADSSTHPPAPYSETEVMELQELLSQRADETDLLGSFTPLALSSGRMVSAMDIATILAAELGTDAATPSILTEYAHGAPWHEIYLHIHEHLATAQIKRALYQPVELVARHITAAAPTPHEQATLDATLLKQVAQYKSRLELVAELKAIRGEFVAMMQGITSTELSPSQWRGIAQDPLIQAMATAPPGSAINPDLISYLLMDMADTLWRRYTRTWSGALGEFFKNQLNRLKYWHVITRLERLKHAAVQRPLVYHSVGDHLLELRTLLLTFQRRHDHPDDLAPEALFELHKSPHLDLLQRHDPYVLPAPEHVLGALSELHIQLMDTRRYGVWFNPH